MAINNYLPFVTPGWSFANTTQTKLGTGYVSWGMMDTLPVPPAAGKIYLKFWFATYGWVTVSGEGT